MTQSKDIEKKHKVVVAKQISQYKTLEESISEKLGTKTKIKNGKIEISFTNDNDLNRILEILNITV